MRHKSEGERSLQQILLLVYSDIEVAHNAPMAPIIVRRSQKKKP